MIGSKETSVATTTVGGALAIVLVFMGDRFGIKLDPTEAAMLVSAFTIIFNYFIPVGMLIRFRAKK